MITHAMWAQDPASLETLRFFYKLCKYIEAYRGGATAHNNSKRHRVLLSASIYWYCRTHSEKCDPRNMAMRRKTVSNEMDREVFCDQFPTQCTHQGKFYKNMHPYIPSPHPYVRSKISVGRESGGIRRHEHLIKARRDAQRRAKQAGTFTDFIHS